jgi:hypothetical protein
MVQAERHIRQISLRGAELEPDVAGTLFRVRSSYDDLSWSTVLVAGWGRRLWSEGCGAKVVERRLWSEGCGAKVVERRLWSEGCRAKHAGREIPALSFLSRRAAFNAAGGLA